MVFDVTLRLELTGASWNLQLMSMAEPVCCKATLDIVVSVIMDPGGGSSKRS